MDGNADTATVDYVVASGATCDAGSELLPRIDVAADVEITDVSILDVAERGTIVFVEGYLLLAVAEGQCVATAIEMTFELIAISAGHCRNGDVGAKLIVGGGIVAHADVHFIDEFIPLCNSIDDIGIFLNTSARATPPGSSDFVSGIDDNIRLNNCKRIGLLTLLGWDERSIGVVVDSEACKSAVRW